MSRPRARQRRPQSRQQEKTENIKDILCDSPYRHAVQDGPPRQHAAAGVATPAVDALRRLIHAFSLILLKPGRRIGAQHGKNNGEEEDVRLSPVIQQGKREQKKEAQGAVRWHDTAKRKDIQPEQLKDDAEREAQFPLIHGKAESNTPEKRPIGYTEQERGSCRPREDKKKP